MPPDERTASFGYWVRRRRQALDLTQADLARRIGCATVTVSKIERDERRPSRQMAQLLAQALALPEDEQEAFLAAALGEMATDRMTLAQDPVQAPEAEAPLASPRPHSNLPRQLTPLIGREQELTAVVQLLHDPQKRLITLLGPGGTGKTRLSLAVAEAQESDFADGVFFVSLIPAHSQEAAVSAMAGATGFTFRSEGNARQQLLDFLQAKSMLLVLDGCEQLLPPLAELVQAILAHAPNLRILATSRLRLNLQAENLYPLYGLDYPQPDDGLNLIDRTGLETYGAVALFLQNARRVRPDFQPTDPAWPAVVEICRLTDGLPLALILAAGWTTLLSPPEIAAEIRRNLDFLAGDLQDLPPRQRSLRAVLDHTWQLLSGAERQVLPRLSLFLAGFDREAAQSVAGAGLPELMNLSARSLLQRTEDDRFQLHELLRHYANDRLAELPDEGKEVRRRHSDYYCSRLAELAGHLRGRHQPDALAEMDRELGNLLQAWHWAAEQGQFATLDATLHGLYEYFHLRGKFNEGAATLGQADRLLAEGSQPADMESGVLTTVRSRIRSRWGALIFRGGDRNRSEVLLRAGLTDAEEKGDLEEACFCLNQLGMAISSFGQAAQSLHWFERAVRYAEVLQDNLLRAEALANVAWIHTHRATIQEGLTHNQQSLALYQAAEAPQGISNALDRIAYCQLKLGDFQGAESSWRKSLEISRKLGDPVLIIKALGGLAHVYSTREEPDLAKALHLNNEAVAMARQIGWRYSACTRLAFSGHIANHLGSHDQAEAFLQESIAIGAEGVNLGGCVLAHGFLAEGLCQRGRPQEAGSHLEDGLTLALQLRNHTMSFFILAVAEGFLAEGLLTPDLSDRAPGDADGSAPVRLAELLNASILHPGNYHSLRRQALTLLPQVEDRLSPNQAVAARKRGEAMGVAELVRQALSLVRRATPDADVLRPDTGV